MNYIRKILISVTVLTFIMNVVAYAENFYVSPSGSDKNPGTISNSFATIQKARDTVRVLISKGLDSNVTIYMRAGTYFLDDSLVFDDRDSGTKKYSVTYCAYPKEKVIISGGVKITNWQKKDNNIWTAYIDDIKTGKWEFSQLFTGDKRLTRARFPNEGQYLIVQNVKNNFVNSISSIQLINKFANNIISNHVLTVDQKFPGNNLADKGVELVMLHSWSTSRSRIKKTEDKNITTFYPIGWIGHGSTSVSKGRKMYLEHALEFIDVPGEWYLNRDTGILHMMMDEGQNPNKMHIVAAKVEKLLELRGTQRSPIRNVHFKGIDFEHANWNMPLAGYAGIQAGFNGHNYILEPTYGPPVTMLWEYAKDCSYANNRLAHTGASGLAFGAGCDRNKIIDSEFFDIGGNAVMVGWQKKATLPPRQMFESDWGNLDDAPQGNVVSGNHIHHCATVQYGGVGIFEAFSADTVITNNNIHDQPYSGISIGLAWNDRLTSQKRANISYNHIHDVMMMMNDGGGIYVLGYQPGTVVHHNLIHDVPNGHGFYTDEGSSHILFENNIVYRAGQYGYQHHYGHDNIIRNNIFVLPAKAGIRRAGVNDRISFIVEKNIFYLNTNQVTFGEFSGDKKFIFRNNLYFNIKGQNLVFDEGSFKDWQKRGQDVNSIIDDPLFEDIEKDNYNLKPDSPAFNLGFKPIDLKNLAP